MKTASPEERIKGQYTIPPKPDSSGYRPPWLRPVEYERIAGLHTPISATVVLLDQ
ncbi:hypothetical protein [Mucilaginibacter polytrichastri]|uniref:hypothetical protein n=1 Tax=Mucilaginibacter polytrichastri TaxID=1302689 RepID=UPI0015C53989|nr:hypothetical protein [Mucilaginibacter polytrichastri]